MRIRLQYYISFQEVSCHRWVEDEERWEVGSCEVTQVSILSFFPEFFLAAQVAAAYVRCGVGGAVDHDGYCDEDLRV